MSVTANDEEKFGAAILRVAIERANTPDGEAELKGFSKDQFLDTLKRITEVVDQLPGTYSIHSLYLALNYIGAQVVQSMEANRQRMIAETGGRA